jgi:hypothetical protein
VQAVQRFRLALLLHEQPKLSNSDLAGFANAVETRRAMGIVAAASFGDDARADLEGRGLRTLDLSECHFE